MKNQTGCLVFHLFFYWSMSFYHYVRAANWRPKGLRLSILAGLHPNAVALCGVIDQKFSVLLCQPLTMEVSGIFMSVFSGRAQGTALRAAPVLPQADRLRHAVPARNRERIRFFILHRTLFSFKQVWVNSPLFPPTAPEWRRGRRRWP